LDERQSDEMMDSRWYRQVTNRADRLVQRMRNIPDTMDQVVDLFDAFNKGFEEGQK
jgi:hypothetical protein